MRRSQRIFLCVATLLASFLTGDAFSQVTTCKTSNCAVGKDGGGNPNKPAECQNRATPRQLNVNMDSTTLRFVPQDLRIEGESATPGVPGNWQCIQWHKVGPTAVLWHSATEDTAGSSCNTATACTATNTTPPCDWETGNIENSGASPLEYSVCHYKVVPPGSYHYRCRLHGAPPFGMMVGSFTLVNPIKLLINKGPGGEAMLDWASGGVGPWDVLRDATRDMPAATNLAPDTVLRAFTDATPLAPGGAFYYLVMESN